MTDLTAPNWSNRVIMN